MLDEEYGEGDQGIVLVSLSFGRFAFVGAYHVYDLFKQRQLEVLDMRNENPVPLDDTESEEYDQLVEVFGETFAA